MPFALRWQPPSPAGSSIILELPCYIKVKGYTWQARATANPERNPYSMELHGANSIGGPWTAAHSFSGETGWTMDELRTWSADSSPPGPFRFFRFNVTRIDKTEEGKPQGGQAYFLAASVTEDECSAGIHNCDSQEGVCTNTAGSFTCHCNSGFSGDGVSCGIQIPPSDIGRGDIESFSWTKDAAKLYNGFVTIHKTYSGAVCPGEYRVYSSDDWRNNPGVSTSTAGSENLPSSLFDGDFQGSPWKTTNALSGLSAASESSTHVILGTPCHILLAGYAWQAKDTGDPEENPSSLTVSGANSTSGPWTVLHSFEGVTDWTAGEIKSWPVDVRTGPFNFFRFGIRRVMDTADAKASGDQAFLYANRWTEVNECSTGLHNCDPLATCTNTDGSFTCACPSSLDDSGWDAVGVLCGKRIPETHIGRGDSDGFSWTKDDDNLFNGFVTIYKDYSGSVCPGRYRVYSFEDWGSNPGITTTVDTGNENPPSSLFDGSELGKPWNTAASDVASFNASADSNINVMLGTPCYLTPAGYAWQAHELCCQNRNPSKMTVWGGNSTSGPWTAIGSFEGETGWSAGETKTWKSDDRSQRFNFFKFNVKRIQDSQPGKAAGDQAFFWAADWAELDECAAGVHNCDSQATCTNTEGSFTCACTGGLEGDGAACGVRIPPSDIGRGDSESFTWTKDTSTLFNGFVTIYKDYSGSVCPGRYRVYTSHDWGNNPGLTTSIATDENPPSSLFDGNTAGEIWKTQAKVAGLSNTTESEVHIILGTPCSLTLSG
uniref:EGF-like domain-containing protein n=1 Tax=Chromera velia CCMP2878 TaxID=1169474 RepID=A0A0G4F815_9ALVE|eukprot:Cvel_15703.t1-p1 / transcript=Cvel_15703.t1 / gene=Cvel_15703 / organism=Chromera_velia_CCMP2878 / gene_product=Pro-epidermal growth factor, putative / transcript_product=Pro-epidermal growth factor, putative / location=Cvel_scaffold1173:2230-10613(+) / protein_length=772 / sequence_SO=supercontig / SO=protein_coding / is_pseudo=false